METSRQENRQGAVSPPKKQRLNSRLAQETGILTCKHCPFRTGRQESLVRHEKYHSAKYPFQCNFCTFSSKSPLNLVAHHINRVHLEERKAKGYLVQPANNKETTNVEPTGEEQPENFAHPKEPVEQVETTKTAAEVEIVEGEEDVVMEREEKLDEMKCLCGHPQPAFGDGSAVSCSQCDDRFHEHCVYITPKVYEQMDELEEPWICSHCLNKEPPVTHKTTQFEVVDTSAKQCISSPRYNSSPLTDLSDDGYLEPQIQNGNLSTTSETPSSLPTLLLPQEEEIYSSERSTLLQEIQTASDLILNMKKSLKEETREMQMARSRAAKDLRKKMEELEKEVHSQSVHLVVLKEQNESIQQKLNQLAAQKIQLGRDIINLRQDSLGKKKIKLELMASESSSTDFEEEVWRKKTLLKDAKEKLPVVQREETHLVSRIQGVEEEKRENILKLAKMRDDLESLVGNRGDVTRPSVIGAQLEALIDKQQIRINRFSWLEIKLAQINYKLHLNDICKEKERWLDHLMDYNVE